MREDKELYYETYHCLFLKAPIDPIPLLTRTVSFAGAGIARAPALNTVKPVIKEDRCMLDADILVDE